MVSCRPFTGDQHRPSPRLPPSPNNEHRIGTHEKDGALVTGLAIAPQGIVGFAAGALGARLAARMGTRWLLVLTNGVATFGFLALTHLPATGGVINTSRQIGAGIGAALLPAIAITASHGGGTAGVGGDRAAMLAGAVTAGLATLVAWRSRGMDAASEHDSQRT